MESVSKYIEVFREECPQSAMDNIVLVGTKLDNQENRTVSEEEAREICSRHGCMGYFETSASTGENVDEAFFNVAAKAFQ